MYEPGVIRNREYAQQLRNFSGLRFGKITPTDIDAFLDFGRQMFVFVEVKYAGADMPYGQALAYQHLAQVLEPVVPTYVLVAKHDTLINQDIDVGACPLVTMWYEGRWRSFDEEICVGTAIDRLLRKNNLLYVRNGVKRSNDKAG